MWTKSSSSVYRAVIVSFETISVNCTRQEQAREIERGEFHFWALLLIQNLLQLFFSILIKYIFIFWIRDTPYTSFFCLFFYVFQMAATLHVAHALLLSESVYGEQGLPHRCVTVVGSKVRGQWISCALKSQLCGWNGTMILESVTPQ